MAYLGGYFFEVNRKMNFLKDQRREIRSIIKEYNALRRIKKYIYSKESFSELNFEEETHCIVWQFWEDNGRSDEQKISNRILKRCLNSIENYRYSDYDCYVLKLRDVSRFVCMPDFVYKKLEGNVTGFSLAAYSDILRLYLLAKYGGIWADATMFALSPFPREYLSLAKRDGYGFSFSRSLNEKEDIKRKWRHLDPGYFSWNKFSRVNWLSSFIVAGEYRKLMREMLRILFLIWKYEVRYPHYFTLHIIYDYLTKHLGYPAFHASSDVPPHYLQFALREPYNSEFIERLIRCHPLQKLTWKYDGEVVTGSNLEWLIN